MERNADKIEIGERYGLICSSTASLLLHCAAFALLGYSATVYPVIASSSPKEILWFYPSLLFGSTAVSREDAGASPAGLEHEPPVLTPPVRPDRRSATAPPIPTPDATETAETPGEPTDVEAPGKPAAPSLTLAPSPTRIKAASMTHASPPAATTPQPTSERTAPSPPTAAKRASEPEAKAQPPSVEKGKDVVVPAAQAAALPDVASGRGTVDSPSPPGTGRENARETPPPGERTARTGDPLPRPAAFSPGRDTPPPREKGPPVRGTGKPSAAATGAQAVAPVGVKAAQTATAGRAVPPMAAGGQPAPDMAATRETPRTAPPSPGEAIGRTPESTPAATRGLFVPPLIGDIKFELVAKERLDRGVRVLVGFRSYPRSVRGRTLSRSEATRIAKAAPTVVMPKENAIHAIIDRAADGIYYLRLELDRPQIQELTITVRLFEGSSRARTKSVRIRSTSHGEPLIRLLMPEGMIWEDDSAFSGSLEDSDSVTKFDSQSGIEWKEYR